MDSDFGDFCSTEQNDIIVVGSVIVDLAVFVNKFPKPGETLTGNQFILAHGGKGANQCVMAKKLGANVSFVGKIGDDTFGQNYRQHFHELGVNIDHLWTTSEAATGIAQITVNSSAENCIVIVPGANFLLTVDDVEKTAKLIRQSKVLLCQMEISRQATECALKIASGAGVTTILNTAPIPDDLHLDDPVFQYVDILCANEHEVTHLCGLPCGDFDEAKLCAESIQEKTPRLRWIFITMGAAGVLLLNCFTLETMISPAPKVVAVDTTGAGDAFVGALAYYLARHSDLHMQEMARRACVIAADAVMKVGSQMSYSPRDKLDSALFQ